MERMISFMNGEGFIGHNARSFIAKNVDASRTKDNIKLINEDIKQVYHKLFNKALVFVPDYKKQKRAKEVTAFEAKLENVQVILDLKEERAETLEKEI